MKKFLTRIFIFTIIVYLPIVIVNYFADPANLYHTEVPENAAEALVNGNIIISPGDMNEGLFKKALIQKIKTTPDTVILGSSRVMYCPWEYDNYLTAGMSGSYLGDYYAIVGLLIDTNKMPYRIVFGVDPWAFMTSYSDGRHNSIKNYALIAHNNVVKEQEKLFPNIDNVQNEKITELLEILSFSYFQSSLNIIKENGISYILKSSDERIVISDNENIEEKSKILPNGRCIMSLKGLNSVTENNNAAQNLIESKSIYQLGQELRIVDKTNFDDFKKLVNYLQGEGIEVQIYLPSWYPSIYDYFTENEKFAGVLEAEELLRKFSKENDITIHGSYDPQKGGVCAEDYADWLHLKAEKMLENYNTIVD